MVNLDDLSFQELQELLELVSQRYQEMGQRQQEAIAQSRADIAAAISAMQALLGPAEGDADTDSIRGVLRFPDEVLADKAGVALRLAFIGMESLTRSVINAAKILAT